MESLQDKEKLPSARLRQRLVPSLASDVDLLNCMQELSQRITSRANEVVGDLEVLERDMSTALIRVENCIQNLIFISTKQFIEKRVYDEEVSENREQACAVPVSKPQMDFVPKIKEALSASLPSVKSKLGGSLLDRSLPYLLGSEEFIDSPTVGVAKRIQPQKVEQNAIKIPSQIPAVTSSAESLPGPNVNDESDETSEASSFSSQTVSVLPVKPPNLQEELAARLQNSGVIITKPTVPFKPESPAAEPVTLPQAFPQPTKKKTLFDDSTSNSGADSDQDLFRPAAPPKLILPQAQAPSLLSRPVESQSANYPPTSDAIKVNGTPATIKTNKPNLFGSSDSEDDLFDTNRATAPAIKPVARESRDEVDDIFSAKPAPAPKNIVKTLPVPQKPVAISAVTHRKPGSLFDDSDSDDGDLFGSIPASQPTRPESTLSQATSASSSRMESPEVQPALYKQSTPVKPPPAENGAFERSNALPAPAAVPKKPTSLFFGDDSEEEDLFGGLVPINKPPDPSVGFSTSTSKPAPPASAPRNAAVSSVSTSDGGMSSLGLNGHIHQLSGQKPVVVSDTSGKSETTTRVKGPESGAEAAKNVDTSSTNLDPNSLLSAQEPSPRTLTAPTGKSLEVVGSVAVDPKIDSAPSLVESSSKPVQHQKIMDVNRNTEARKPTYLFADDSDDEDLFANTALRVPAKITSAPTVAVVPSVVDPKPETLSNPPSSFQPVPQVKMAYVKMPSVEASSMLRSTTPPLVPPQKVSPVEATEQSDQAGAEEPPLSTTGRIAALKLSLSKQPNSMPFVASRPGSAVTSPSDEGEVSPIIGSAPRKTFGGVPMFGGPLPIAALVKREQIPQPTKSVKEGEPSTESLPSLASNRPRAPANRRPPSRAFRHSQIIEDPTVISGGIDDYVEEGKNRMPPQSVSPPPQVSKPTQLLSEGTTSLFQSDGDVFKHAAVIKDSSQPVDSKPTGPKTVLPTAFESSSDEELFKPVVKQQSKSPDDVSRATSKLVDSTSGSDDELFKPSAAKPLQALTKPPKAPPPAPASKAIDDHDNSDDELFGQSSAVTKTAEQATDVKKSANGGVKSNVKINTTIPSTGSDSDDGLFGGSKVTAVSPRKPVLPPSFLADSDGDEDDLFSSVPKSREHLKPPVAPSQLSGDHRASVVADDPLLGSHK